MTWIIRVCNLLFLLDFRTLEEYVILEEVLFTTLKDNRSHAQVKIVFKRRVEYHIVDTFSQVTSNNTMGIVLPIFIWFLLTLQYIMNPLINFTDFTHGLDWIYTFLLWSRKNFRSSDSCLDFYSGYCNNGFINSRSKYHRNISILILLLLFPTSWNIKKGYS